jgi:hypothetical protein
MKILLLHFEDDPQEGPWANLPWDRIVDFGMGGKDTYARWSAQFHCPVTTLDSLRNGFDDFRYIRDRLGRGCGRLIDPYGLDWWEIMSILLHGEVETVILLQRLLQTIGSADEVYVSRPGIQAALLQFLRPHRVRVFPTPRRARKGGLGHYLRVSNRLSARQLVDIFWDKYDAGYQFRGRLARKRQTATKPFVLLPTAYINVSRTGLAYAKTFPHENFLLITTRNSGWVKEQDRPPNVAAARLSSYASLRQRTNEYAAMESRWQSLRNELIRMTEFDVLHRLGYLDPFPSRFLRGFEVRDAWRNVLDREPVEAVLCADDNNPYTRIPLLLAQARGLPNIVGHHGALDGRSIFKRTWGDVIWVKGKMEEDYLVQKCSVPAPRIEIAAPALPQSWNERRTGTGETFRPHILFISEVFAAGSGRAEEFYRDILPSLADLAQTTGRTLIVKLHPGESKTERANIVSRILSREQRNATRMVTGPLSEHLLSSAWFAITILSTVAVECAIRGIPCFLCKWLESWPYGYVEQFIRFGVGLGLKSPQEIKSIPQYLDGKGIRPDLIENCWRTAPPERLRELIASSSKLHSAATSRS